MKACLEPEDAEVFDGNIKVTQVVLNVILSRTDLAVKSVAVQKFEETDS